MTMPRPRTILFDFMGTCLNWHDAVVSSLPPTIPAATRSNLALHWRQTYFEANASRQASGLPPEDIDITHRRTLASMIEHGSEFAEWRDSFTETAVEKCIRAWHQQPAWPDVKPALQALKKAGYEIVVHANGTTRLQLDLIRSSGLDEFDTLFSSELMGCYKPAPEAYKRGLKLLQRRPEEVIMVAAHAYDTRGAKALGIRSVYIWRWSDDILEDQKIVQKENDVWIEGMGGLVNAINSFS